MLLLEVVTMEEISVALAGGGASARVRVREAGLGFDTEADVEGVHLAMAMRAFEGGVFFNKGEVFARMCDIEVLLADLITLFGLFAVIATGFEIDC